MKREHMIHIRVNKEEKEEVSEILEELGTSLSAVVNMLIKNIILYKGIPFDVVLPQVSPHLEESDIDSNNIEEPAIVSESAMNISEIVNEPVVFENYATPSDKNDKDVFDTSDLDKMSDMLGISLGQNRDYESNNDLSNQNAFVLGMLDD